MCAFFKFNHSVLRSTVLGLILTASSAQAIDLLDGDMQLHGFFSQGMIHTSNNNFLGQTNDGVSFDFREIGLNSSYRVSPDLQFSGQLMSHFAGESDTGQVDADYAFADWTAASGNWGRGGIRLGRVKNPYGLYNTTRFVPFARPSIILPQSIYFERTRKVAVSSDGVDVYLEWLSDFGTLSMDVTMGWPDSSDKASKTAFLRADAPGQFESKFSQVMQVNFESTDGSYRLAFTSVKLNSQYEPGENDLINRGTFKFEPYTFSAQYNAENWTVTGEYQIRPASLRGFGPRADAERIGESYYLQTAYRVLPELEFLLRYDINYSNQNDKDGEDFARQTGRPRFTQFSRDWTIGLRYDVTQSIMLRAEYHNIDGTAILPSLDNPNPNDLVRRWEMWMLMASYHF